MSEGRPVLFSEDVEKFLKIAREVARNAYAPFSNFPVGAVLLSRSGQTFLGCNVENSSFGLTICAERTAATSAIAAGCRDWVAIVIASPTSVPPCGACLQFLAEFSTNLEIWIGGHRQEAEVRKTTISELLPSSMHLEISSRE